MSAKRPQKGVTKRRTKKKAPTAAQLAARQAKVVTDLRTHERRERVLELLGKPSRLIAKILLEEGFEVDAGSRPVTKDKQIEWERRRIELMRRNVDNDRGHWETKWRGNAKASRTFEDLEVEQQTAIAEINSDIGEISELIIDKDTRSSAKAILYQNKLRARELILKVRGLDKGPEREPDEDEKKTAVVGVVFGVDSISDEVRAELAAQGYQVNPSGER